MEGWFKTSVGDTEALFGYGPAGSTDQTFYVYIEPNEVFVDGWNNSPTWTTSASLEDGSWHYLALTYNGAGSATLYIDGHSMGTQSTSSYNTTVTAGGFLVGNRNDNQLPFNGDIEDVAFYPYALSGTQVANHFAATGITAPGAPTAVSTTAGTNSATVSWSASNPGTVPGGESGLTGYAVEAYSGGVAKSSVAVDPTTTSATLVGLPTGTYTFEVTAYDLYGTSTSAASSSLSISSGVSSTYSSVIEGDSPSLFYRLDDSSGSAIAADSSGSGVPLELNTVSDFLGAPGAIPTDNDTALSLNGVSSDGGSTNSATGLVTGNGARTMEGWFKTSVGDTEALFGYGPAGSTDQTFYVYIEPNEVFVDGWNNSPTWTTSASLEDGSWHYLALTYNGAGSATLYIDGHSMGTQSTSSYNTTVTAGGFLVGNRNDNQLPFNGDIEDVAFYPYALSGTQVANHFAATGITAPGTPTLQGETIGGPNPSELSDPQPSTALGSGLSVNSVTGELDYQATDDSIPGRGEELDLNRTYSSLESSNLGPFGYGWTNSYDMSINSDPYYGASVMDVHQENGSVVYFQENSAGDWVAATRVEASLQKEGGDWVFTRDSGESFTFNSGGQLISESDPNLYTTSLSYNGSGQLTEVTDPEGRSLSFSYGTNGLVSEVSDPGSRTITYLYDGNDNLTSVTDIGGGITTFSYNSEHLLTSLDNSLGGTTTLSYDTARRVVYAHDPMSRVTTWARYTVVSASGPPGTTIVTDPLGTLTKDVIAGGELASQTVAYGTPQASTTTYAYDVTTDGTTDLTTPTGATTDSYDAEGDIISSLDPAGNASDSTYNPYKEVVTSQSPAQAAASVETSNSYDSKGNLDSTTTPVSAGTTTITYTHGDTYPEDVTSMKDADGNTWNYTFDTYGYETSVTDPLGNVTTYTYNDLGEKTSMVSPRGNVIGGDPSDFTTSYLYDAYGNLTKTIDPTGDTTTATYDDLGNKLTSTDALTKTTTYSYDADQESVSTTDPDGDIASSTYDPDGNQMTSTDAKGETTNYTTAATNFSRSPIPTNKAAKSMPVMI